MRKANISYETNILSSGWINGIIAVLLFSGSLPATRVAVLEMNPIFLTVARASIAGLFALAGLLIFKEHRPSQKDIIPLMIVAIGVVIGFPLLSALALQYLTSAHSLVYLGLLPLATASFGVLRGGERPKPLFWIFSIIGSFFIITYAIAQGITTSPIGNSLMLAAVVLCGLGYAEGAKLAKTSGGWQVISWALVLSLPVTIPLVFLYKPSSFETIHISAWIGLAYVSFISMFIAFIFWYKGLAQGGVASIGQLQLLQPFLGLAVASIFLNEQVSLSMIGVTMAVILCVAGSKKYAR